MTHLIDNKGDSLFTTIYPNEGKEMFVLLHGGPGFQSDLTEVAYVLSKRYPTAKLWTIEKYGHLPLLHNPERYNALLNQHFE